MRGRTNVGGSGMLAINAETQQFTVAEGTVITAGDFVEYKTQKNESLLSNSNINFYEQLQVGENLAITLSNNSLLLLKMMHGQLRIIDSYNDYIVYSYAMLSDGSIAARVSSSSYVVRLKIENESFQFVCNAEGIPEDNFLSDIKKSVEYNGKLYLIDIEKTYLSAEKKYRHDLKFYRFNISDANKIIYVDNYKGDSGFLGTTSSTQGSLSLHSVFSVQDYIYIVIDTEPDYSMSRVKIDDETNIPSNYIKIGSVDFRQKPIVFYNKYIFWGFKSKVYLHNINSGTVKNIELDSIGFSDNTSSYYIPYSISSKVGNSKVALTYRVYHNKEICETAILEIDEATSDISMVSNVFVPSFENALTAYHYVLYLNEIVNDIMQTNSGVTKSYAISYDPDANLLTDEIDMTSVKPYEGGMAIGVSKQSGTAGQKIEVYVPKIN